MRSTVAPEKSLASFQIPHHLPAGKITRLLQIASIVELLPDSDRNPSLAPQVQLYLWRFRLYRIGAFARLAEVTGNE